MKTHVRFLSASLALALAVALGGATVAFADSSDGGTYQVTNLVSDGFLPANVTDPNLVNAWGVAFNPFGFVWVADNHTGLSTLYDGDGNIQSLVVQIPTPTALTGGAATGIVNNANPAATSFPVTDPSTSTTGSSKFIFATEDGVIAGWAPSVALTQAFVAVDNSANGAVYKGLAISTNGSTQLIYATDFHNGRVDAFDSTFAPATLSGTFTDPHLPAGYAPFGIQAIGGNLVVTFAKQQAGSDDEAHGKGLGVVDVFDPDGVLLHRVAKGGQLNAPWGIALAPAGFGGASNSLLIGNFGDGTIDVFDPKNYTPRGQLHDSAGKIIRIDGLWGLAFGNGLSDQPVNTLFFAAGPGDEEHGLYGRIDAVPGSSHGDDNQGDGD